MDKVKINNEIVLLRKNVNQARVHIIKKLTREASKLRQKKGTEVQKAKNFRKAEKLAAEILSIKKIKRDDITKFILKNTLTLEEILQNPNSEPLTRIMTRIGNHKNFKSKILEFKNKYPDYKNFLDTGRRKKTLLQKKGKLNMEIDKNVHAHSNNQNMKLNNNDQIVNSNSIITNLSNDLNSSKKLENKDKMETQTEGENEIENEDCNIKPALIQNSVVKTKMKKSLSKKLINESDISAVKIDNLNPKVSKKTIDNSKIISKEAVVKKFNDILQNDEYDSNKAEEINNSVETNIKMEKEVDSFFVLEDGETNYLSVVPAKSKLTDMEDGYDDNINKFSKQNFSRQPNDNFFNTKFKNNDSKFNSNKLNSRWEYPQKNRTSYEQKKVVNSMDLKKFNSEYKNKSNSMKKSFQSDQKYINDEILHPSWEAKKKQQEILKQGFQGKKIVFDDNL